VLFKQEPYEFEDLYRPIYELRICAAWAACAFCVWTFGAALALPPGLMRIQLLICAVMLAWSFARSRRLYNAQIKLLGFKQEFISLPDFIRKSQKYVEAGTVWLGKGFLWTPVQTQRYHEIIKTEFGKIADHLRFIPRVRYHIRAASEALALSGDGAPSSRAGKAVRALLRSPLALFRLFFPKPYHSRAMGQCWIHGLRDSEEDIAIPLDYFKGHCLILGTTGSGKTRLAELLNAQSIMRGECLIIIDPKGDKEMRENARRACDAYRQWCIETGRPDPGNRFFSFHPAFPDESVRLNLLASIARDTDVASRITNLTPSKDGGMDPFVAFGWLAINTIAQAQLLLGENPSIESIKSDLLDSMEKLTDRAITQFCKLCDTRRRKDGTQETDFQTEYDRIAIPAKEAGRLNILGRLFSFAAGGDLPNEASTIIKCAVFQKYENEPDASTISSLVKLYQHPKDHFAKMINNMLPILEMLSTGTLSSMLSISNNGREHSAEKSEQISTLDIIQNSWVLYVGLDSLSDGVVGSAIGSLLLSDLTAAAGRIYNFMGDRTPPINVFVDEAAECLNEPCIRLLNKGRGAKFRLVVATQTIPDFASRLGSQEKAAMVLGNVNNKIALRTEDETSQEYLCKDMPDTVIRELSHSQGQNSLITDPLKHGSTQSEQLKETEAPLVAQQMFGQLPNCEYIASFAGGRIIKGRLPIIGEDMNKRRRPPKARAQARDKRSVPDLKRVMRAG